MSFIARWLGLERSKTRVGLRPHAELELRLSYDAAYKATLEAIDGVLGANVSIDDRAGRLIECGFGLVNSERVRATFEPIDDGTRVRIEAFYPAGTEVPETSRNVDALAAALRGGDAIESGILA